MKTRIIFFLIVFGLSVGLATTSARATSSRSAVVTRTENKCYTDWVADDLQTQTWVYFDMLEIYHPGNGILKYVCHGWVDYSLWEYASLDQLCAPGGPYEAFCNGPHNIQIHNFYCYDDNGNLTTNAHILANEKGNIQLTCLFK